jgi:hypothetical protein
MKSSTDLVSSFVGSSMFRARLSSNAKSDDGPHADEALHFLLHFFKAV